MAKPKPLDQLRADIGVRLKQSPVVFLANTNTEKERAETQLAQEQHKLERLENRKKYLEKGERTKRTHRICKLDGTIESLAPEVKDLTRTEMTELMEYIFSLADVQRAVRHMAITPVSYPHLRLLNQAVGKSLRTHNLKPKKGAQVMRKNEKITEMCIRDRQQVE